LDLLSPMVTGLTSVFLYNIPLRHQLLTTSTGVLYSICSDLLIPQHKTHSLTKWNICWNFLSYY
uniref:Uncharacterized protein n=1 Tax=Monopterus albus TaxID=43700 RepID=A0A3Q3QLG1_MONAL